MPRWGKALPTTSQGLFSESLSFYLRLLLPAFQPQFHIQQIRMRAHCGRNTMVCPGAAVRIPEGETGPDSKPAENYNCGGQGPRASRVGFLGRKPER